MRHKTIKNLLPEYIDNELKPEVRKAVEEHLRKCSACRQYMERLRLLLEEPDLTFFPRLTPDPFLPVRIRALAEEKNRTSAGRASFSTRLKPVLVAVLCIAAFLLGGWMGNHLGEMSAESSPSSAYSGFILPDSTTTFNGIWVEAMDQLVGAEK